MRDEDTDDKIRSVVKTLTPKGLRLIAQGCRAAATLGSRSYDVPPTPRGVVAHAIVRRSHTYRSSHSIQLMLPLLRVPWIVAPPQPRWGWPRRGGISQGSRCAATLG